MIQLEAGQYVICDLCYIIPDELWDNVGDQINFDTGISQITLEGMSDCVLLSTYFGDGFYEDNYNNGYSVDSGQIGIISVEMLKHLGVSDYSEYPVFDYKSSFTVKNDEGTLFFGFVVIDTREDEEDEDYDLFEEQPF